jgi:colanic acid/amylovoran biosynthesis glycosyltransferase
VIATQHGGIPEAVRPGISGILVPERDVSGIFDAMQSLTGTPFLWKSMSAEAAQDMKENFESKTQIEKLEAVYDEAMALSAS